MIQYVVFTQNIVKIKLKPFPLFLSSFIRYLTFKITLHTVPSELLKPRVIQSGKS